MAKRPLAMATTALLFLLLSSTTPSSLGSEVSDGPAQTYWWCEMHHAPQNIPNNKHSNSLVQSLANNLVTGGENKILNDLVDAAEAQPADLRTKVISYSGPKAALTFNGLQTDPAPPQTFWCEMHQGAQNTLETAGEAANLAESLKQLSKDALIARVLEAERKAAEYQRKVEQIQASLDGFP